jgi:hypothetical protein
VQREMILFMVFSELPCTHLYSVLHCGWKGFHCHLTNLLLLGMLFSSQLQIFKDLIGYCSILLWLL